MKRSEIKMIRKAPGNYVSADGRFRAWRDGGSWYALDMRTNSVLARKGTYAEVKHFLTGYADREFWRRKGAFWQSVLRTIDMEEEG